MSGKPPDAAPSRAARRREIVGGEILAAAWQLAREHGLAGLTMRDLGAATGMRAQSLYSYFPSKHAIYDAMFADGYRAFNEMMSRAADVPGSNVERARADAHRFFAFCTDEPVRFQLMFQRTIPGFEPSPASYALAVEALDRVTHRLAATGIDDPAAVDLSTALFAGIASQQIANDPGGTRWQRLIDDAVDMLLARYTPPTRRSRTRTT